MIRPSSLAVVVGTCLALFFASCADSDSDTHEGREHDGNESSDEHDSSESDSGDSDGGGESGSIISDGDEESGIEYSKTDSYDETRRGARLLLRYDKATDAFVGTVENTTAETLEDVRVEVHLSNGVELGPTTPGAIAPGESADITLPAEGEDFQTWGAHPEVGRDEHGTESEGGGEHNGESEDGGEHDGESESD